MDRETEMSHPNKLICRDIISIEVLKLHKINSNMDVVSFTFQGLISHWSMMNGRTVSHTWET